MQEISLQVHVRWLIRRDLDEVMGIERASFRDPREPWTEGRLLSSLRKSDVTGFVAESLAGPEPEILGYMLVRIGSRNYELLRMVVLPGVRRLGIGREMINRLIRPLSPNGRNRLTIHVEDRNLGMQCFLRSCGIRAVGIRHGEFIDCIRFEKTVTE